MPRTFNNGLWNAVVAFPSFSAPDFGAGGGGTGQQQNQGQGNGNQQQGQQGQGQQPNAGQGGQQPGQQGNGGTGILNDPNAGDQGQPNGGQGFQPSGQSQQPTFMSQEQVQQLLAAQDQKWQSEIDRRINQIVQKGKVTPPGGQQGQGQGQGDPGQQQQQQIQAPTVDTSSFDQREARLSYMQYVGDEIRFLNADERNLASNLATAQIPGLIESGLTPNEAGLKAAKEVSGQVKALRTQYEQLVIAGLKRKGVLAESFGAGQGQATTQQGGVGPMSDYQKGVARAQEMFGPPPQTTT